MALEENTSDPGNIADFQEERRRRRGIGSPPTDEDAHANRLADLRRRIRAGEYNVDPRRVAREMMRKGFGQKSE